MSSAGFVTSIEPDRYRHVLGHFPTGVTVATAVGPDGVPAGMAVGSFTSVSLDPPLVAFLPDKSSSSFPKIRGAGAFCVNVLADDQEPVCRAFAARGADKFAGISWRPAPSGSPILDGVLAWIDCEIEEVLEAGDHYIALGRVRDLSVAPERAPLLFFQRGYGRFRPASLAAAAEPDLLGRLGVLDPARPEMERLAADLAVECIAVTRLGDELVTLASTGRAFGGDSVARIGQRMPFVPPLGALFLAWSPPAETQAWLDRLDPGMAASDADLYRAMVERAKRRGFSIAVSSRSWIAFELSLVSRTPGPSSDQMRDITEAARNVGPASHEPADDVLVDPRGIRVRNVTAPVFGDRGEVVLTLTLVGLPRTCLPGELGTYRDRLLEATASITRSLGGTPPGMAAV